MHALLKWRQCFGTHSSSLHAHVQDGDVEKCALLAQYFHRCDDPHWFLFD